MKNLALKNSEKLEDLPNRTKIRQKDRWYDRHNDYPWKRVNRFIASNVGKNWDDVYSKYCKLEWVPARHKTVEQIGHTVILNTFYRDGDVWYYDKYGRYAEGNERKVADVYRESFYVHPKNKILCRQVPARSNRKKQYAIEQAKTMRILGDYHQLLKLDGIWHEVKGEPVKPDIIEVDGLHYRVVPHMWNPKDHTTKFKIIDGKICVPHQHNYYGNRDDVGPKDRLISANWGRKNYNTIKITLCRQLNSKELKKYGVKNDGGIIGIRCKKCGGIVGKDCNFHVCSNCGKYRGEDCKCHPWGI